MSVVAKVYCDRCGAAVDDPDGYVKLMQMGAGKQYYQLRDTSPTYTLEFCLQCVVALRSWMREGRAR